jgi:hypothetical protein
MACSSDWTSRKAAEQKQAAFSALLSFTFLPVTTSSSTNLRQRACVCQIKTSTHETNGREGFYIVMFEGRAGVRLPKQHSEHNSEVASTRDHLSNDGIFEVVNGR